MCGGRGQKELEYALQNGIGYGRDFIIMNQKWFLDIYEIRFDIQMCVRRLLLYPTSPRAPLVYSAFMGIERAVQLQPAPPPHRHLWIYVHETRI